MIKDEKERDICTARDKRGNKGENQQREKILERGGGDDINSTGKL